MNNLKLINSFNDYLDYAISQQHKVIEQADDLVTMHRAQGAIMSLRKLKFLREEVNAKWNDPESKPTN